MKAPQPHRIDAVAALDGNRLCVGFADGWTTTIDIGGFIAAKPVLAPLLDTDLFSQAAVGEWGFDVTWDHGGDLTLAATLLREMAEQQSGGPAAQFNRWMQRNNLSLSAAAKSLGMTRRMIAHYRTGSRPIPKTVLLACTGWEVEQDRMKRVDFSG